MRISDWSSDVCSSDLNAGLKVPIPRSSFPEPKRKATKVREAGIRSAIRLTMPKQSNFGGSRIRSLSASFQKPSPTKRSEEHTSELQSLMRISYAVFCLKKKKTQ